MEWASTLQGIIISGFMGLVAGNFATSPIFRLPRNESLFGRDPYCGDCNAMLQPKDLFPVLSWLSTKGKCRYCGAPVPGAYTFAEAVIALLFVVFFLQHGFSETFMLLSFSSATLIALAMMLYIDNYFSDRTFGLLLALGAVYRTLTEATVYGFAGGVFAGLMLGGAIWKLSKKPMARDFGAFPAYLKLLIATGGLLTFPKFLAILPVCAFAALVREHKKWLPEYAIIGSAIAVLLIHT